MSVRPTYALRQMLGYFLKLGTTGFGGPVALVGYMHRDLVEQRGWITEDEYKEGLALAQLAPGPLAAQLGIYMGFVHYGFLGASLCGLAFVLPSFLMVLLIGMAYTAYGGLGWMQAVFYGVGAACIGVIAVGGWKLTTKAVGKLELAAMRQRWLLWSFYLAAAVATVITEREEVLLLVLAGLVYMVVKEPPAFITRPKANGLVLLAGATWASSDPGVLGRMAWFFTQAGAFVFGSGLAIVPYLHGGVVDQYGWLNERQFIDAVAVAMITPGPVVITVGFIGYLVAGFPGACVAALATFFPCWLITVVLAPHFKRIAKDRRIKAFVDGITASVVGALVGAVIVIASRTVTDLPTALIAAGSAGLLFSGRKVQEPWIILAAAALGLLLK